MRTSNAPGLLQPALRVTGGNFRQQPVASVISFGMGLMGAQTAPVIAQSDSIRFSGHGRDPLLALRQWAQIDIGGHKYKLVGIRLVPDGTRVIHAYSRKDGIYKFPVRRFVVKAEPDGKLNAVELALGGDDKSYPVKIVED
ncbi:MAG TPA: hypothetical protein V6C52_14395 [Coleofasciculaceae cyanobacterium]